MGTYDYVTCPLDEDLTLTLFQDALDVSRDVSSFAVSYPD